MALPVMTPEMREHALRRAAETRQERSAALAALKKGEVTPAAVLAGEVPPLLGAKVSQVLRAIPGIGKVKAGHLMAAAGITDTRRVRGLGVRQQADLAGLLASLRSA